MWESFRIEVKSEFVRLVFCCGLWFWSDVFSSKNDEYVFNCSFVAGIYVSENLQCVFLEVWMKRVIFHRPWHFWLHLEHSLANSSNFWVLPSKISVFAVVGLNIADDHWRCCWDAITAIASTGLMIGLLESEFCLYGVCSTIGSVWLGKMWVVMFSGWVNCCSNVLCWVWIRPVRYSGTLLSGALCPITMCNMACHSCHQVMSVRSPVVIESCCRELAVLGIINITSLIRYILIII